MPVFVQIVLATCATSAISLIGGIILLRKSVLRKQHVSLFISFAAGVVLTTAFLDLLPEAVEHAPGLPVFDYVLLGVVVFFFLERLIVWFHHHYKRRMAKPTTTLILLGDGIHNIFDGIAIATAFLVNPSLGIVTTIAIAAHEIPHEIADFTILIHHGMKKSRALFFNFISGLTSLVGAVAGYLFLTQIERYIPFALALSAGIFIYIACSDLIPEMHEEFKNNKKWQHNLPFIVALVIGYVLVTSFHY